MTVCNCAEGVSRDPDQRAVQKLTHAPTVSVTMSGPSGNDRTGCSVDGARNDAVVIRADRVFDDEKLTRVCRSVREQFHELHAAHPRPSRVADTSPNRLVVDVGVGCAGAQQHEEHPRAR